jgi:hypothetical protein
VYNIFVENPVVKRNHWQDRDVDGRIGSEWILGGLAWGMWSGFTWLRIGTGGGLL